MMQTARRSKYGNKKVVLDGIKFDSQHEAERYAELKVMQKAGRIKDLKLQVKFELQPAYLNTEGKRVRAIRYIADFTYVQDDKLVIEDAKSPATRKNKVYMLKRKMMGYRGYEIREV